MVNTLNNKVQDVLQAARSLFWKHGIRRITIQEICRRAGVSKTTFYKHFANKQELVKVMLKSESRAAMERYRRIMDQDISYKEKVKHMIRLKQEQTHQLSREFMRDMRQWDPEMERFFQQLIQSNMAVLLQDFTQAQREGHIRKDISPAFILYFLNHMFEMSNDERLTALYNTPQEVIMELTNFLFYGVLAREDIS